MPKGLNRKVLFLRDVSGTRGAPEGKSFKLADSCQEKGWFFRPNRQCRPLERQ